MVRVMRLGMAGLVVLLVAGQAFAVPTYYTDRASFDAASGGGLDFESFESLANLFRKITIWHRMSNDCNFQSFITEEKTHSTH